MLDELLQTYSEDEIITSRKDIPRIFYFLEEDGKLHRYYPDIWIPKHNLIIEVKSSWTYINAKEFLKNLAKEKRTIELGYNYNLVIYDSKFNKISKEECISKYNKGKQKSL